MSNDSVIIAGAGPVGVTAALALAKAGMHVTVIDADAAPNMSPRAIVYLHPLLPDLDRLGVLDDMRAKGHIDHEGFNMHLVLLDEVLSAPNTDIDDLTPTPFNVHMGQGDFTTIVLEHLDRLDNVEVLWGARLTDLIQSDDSVTATIETAEGARELRAGWLVGADGGRSTVRELIGATLDGTTWGERFVATNLRYDFRARGFFSSNLYIHPANAAVIAQINSAGLWRCTFQEDESLPEDTVEERIHEFLRSLLGDDAEYELVDYRPYRMHQRLASKLREGRVLLAGDAAHLTNPTGGLGLTTGLYDVLALEEVLPAVAFGRSSDDALDRYAQDRARVFSEISSPQASHLKRLVYGGLGADELRELTQPLRELTATRDGRRTLLMGLDGVRSPSLVDATVSE